MSIIESTFKDIDLSDNLLETMVQGVPTKTNNYYGYVKSVYPGKLPSGNTLLDTRFYDIVKAGLVNNAGFSHMNYVRFGAMNAYHEAWLTLVGTKGLDPLTGKMSAYSGQEFSSAPSLSSLLMGEAKSTDVIKVKGDFYVLDIKIEIPLALKAKITYDEVDNYFDSVSQSSIGYWTVGADIIPAFKGTGIIYSAEATVVSVVVSGKVFSTEKEALLLPEEKRSINKTIKVPLRKLNDGSSYYQFSWVRKEKESDEPDAGDVYIPVFGEIWHDPKGSSPYDLLVTSPSKANPINVFYPHIYYRFDKREVTEEAYTYMGRKLKLDTKKISESVHKNEDIADVASAMFSMGVNADSTNSIDCVYLFDFFSNIHKKIYGTHGAQPFSLNKYLDNWNVEHANRDLTDQRSAITIQDDKTKYALTFEKVVLTSHEGSLYEIGKGGGGSGTETRKYKRSNSVRNFDGDETYTEYLETVPIKYRYYRKQITRFMYEEIRVYNLAMSYFVFEDYKSTLGDEDKELCLIPLDKTLIDSYPFSIKNELLLRSYSLISHSHQVQKLKWYQHGLGKDLFFAAAIVAAIYGGYELLTEAVAIATTAGITAALIFVAIDVTVKVLVSLVLKIFVKAIGGEAALFIAFLASIRGMSDGGFAKLTAKDLLSLATGVFNAVGAVVKDSFDDLQKEIDSFLSLKSTQEDQLEAAEKLLESPINSVGQVIFGESPDQFLYRTLVFVKSGYRDFNDVSTYTERALQLPHSFDNTSFIRS